MSSITHPVECIKRRIETRFAVNHLNLTHSVELHKTGGRRRKRFHSRQKLLLDLNGCFMMEAVDENNTFRFSLAHETLCNGILDFLTNRPQTVWIGTMLVLNTGAPQGCALGPLLFTTNTIVMNNEESSCQGGNHQSCRVVLNVRKTKKLIVDL